MSGGTAEVLNRETIETQKELDIKWNNGVKFDVRVWSEGSDSVL